MTDTAASPARKPSTDTAFVVLFAISFCHLLNDMMQALLSAIYPSLKASLHLNFAQIGLITLAFQCTASLLQPAIGICRRQAADALVAAAAAWSPTLVGLAGAVAWPAAIRW